MKREIKFRAWDGKKMLYDNDNSNLMVEHYNSVWSVFCQSLQDVNKDFILMQFTGLKDKNGKDIYERDVVAYHDWRDDGTGYSEKILISEPVYYGGGSFYPISNQPPDEFEVIGNIYENPEILKENTK